uniref:Uncharacterized protein n=1 Tax=Fagus sylvatica TaxID=28930 RepID=A0A2N9HP25_FAGSY
MISASLMQSTVMRSSRSVRVVILSILEDPNAWQEENPGQKPTEADWERKWGSAQRPRRRHPSHTPSGCRYPGTYHNGRGNDGPVIPEEAAEDEICAHWRYRSSVGGSSLSLLKTSARCRILTEGRRTLYSITISKTQNLLASKPSTGSLGGALPPKRMPRWHSNLQEAPPSRSDGPEKTDEQGGSSEGRIRYLNGNRVTRSNATLGRISKSRRNIILGNGARRIRNPPVLCLFNLEARRPGMDDEVRQEPRDQVTAVEKDESSQKAHYDQ